jgi:hypothetical protein
MPDTNACWPILKTSIKVAHSLVCYAWQMMVSVSKYMIFCGQLETSTGAAFSEPQTLAVSKHIGE